MSAFICRTCGTVGSPRTITGGSCLIEGALWLLLIVPGLIYSLWRLTTKRKGCARCGGADMVPVDSPAGQELVRRFAATPPQ